MIQSKYFKNPYISLVLHFVIWQILYFLPYLPNFLTYLPKIFWREIIKTYLVFGTINFLFFYILAIGFLPYFLKRKKWLTLFILCIAAFILFTFIKNLTTHWFTQQYLEEVQVRFGNKGGNPFPFKPFRYADYLLSNFAIIFVAFCYALLKQWYQHEHLRKELENQKLKAELSFLKLQVNPHFLFNALNNIYSLSVLERSKKTSDGILILSNLIRYMLYEKEDESHRVSLDKEIAHINNFIDLEKLRQEKETYVKFTIEGDTTEKRIPPLLLFPLIENSYKHGLVNDPNKPITIEIIVTDHTISSNISNFKNDYQKSNVGGIGLENVRKRIALMFPNNHIFIVTDTKEDFSIKLQFPI